MSTVLYSVSNVKYVVDVVLIQNNQAILDQIIAFLPRSGPGLQIGCLHSQLKSIIASIRLAP